MFKYTQDKHIGILLKSKNQNDFQMNKLKPQKFNKADEKGKTHKCQDIKQRESIFYKENVWEFCVRQT